MRGDHERRHAPVPGCRYALLGDVAAYYGQLSTCHAVDRQLWLGVKHATLYGKILALACHWHATFVVVDAMGVGAGLASFLEKALCDRLIAVQFGLKVKSKLGWDLLVEAGRYRDYVEDAEPDTRQFWYEVEHCQHEIRHGPGQAMRWDVWETLAYDGLVARGHGDLLMSAAIVAILDKQQWPGTGESGVVEWGDVLEEIDAGDW